MPTTAPSALEAEMMKATKLRQAANEPRHKYLGRLLEGGQDLPPSLWNTLSPEAQAWYNDGINAYNVHQDYADIPDFVDIAPPATVVRATMTPRKPEAEPEPKGASFSEHAAKLDPDEDLSAAPVEEDEFEDLTEESDEAEDEYVDDEAVTEPEEEEAEEPPPPKAAAPKKAPPKAPPKKAPPKAPPKKAPPKAPAKPKAEIKTDSVSRPPKPGAPGASTMIKRLLIKDINITNAELMEKLGEQGVSVTAITVSTIRSDFRHSLRVLQEAGYATDIAASLK